MKSHARAPKGSSSIVVHALAGERAGVLDRLLADAAETRVIGRIVLVGRLAFEHPAGAELSWNSGSFG